MVIYYRYHVLVMFGFVYTDSDQNIMWEGLKNYSEGRFYEPRFYGQAYNTFMEAFFAVPFYRKEMPPYMALPLVSTILSLTPFVVISFFTLLKRSKLSAFIIVSLPLLLPADYAMICTMPRGFVTGIFVAGFGCIPAFYEKSRWSFFFAGLLAVIAFSVNSNAVLVSAPCLLYLLLVNLKNRRFYLIGFAGLAVGAAAHFAVQHFYVSHPFYDVHKISIEFSFNRILEGLKKTDAFLNINSPVSWQHGYITLFLFVLFAFQFFRHGKYAKAVTALFVPFLIILTFGINKVYDGNESIFFHYARMYLSVPVTLAFCLALFEPDYQPPAFYLWVFVPHFYFKEQLKNFETTMTESVKTKHIEVVIVSKVELILKDCRYLSKICIENEVDLFVVANHFYFDAYTHGCAACLPKFPKTLDPHYERRTWRLLEDEKRVYRNVMFIDMDNRIAEGYDFIKKIPGTVDLYLVKNNTLETMKLLDTLKIPYRAFK